MNKKTKLLLLATPMLGATLIGASSVSTFAWITSIQQLGISHTNIKVATDSAYVTSTFYRINPSSASMTAGTGVETGAELNENLTDRSMYNIGDASSKFGMEFYRMNTFGTGYELVSNTSTVCLSYGLKIETKETAANKSLSIYSRWNDLPSSDNIVSPWVRMAVVECTDTDFTPKEGGFQFVFAKNTNAPYNKYVCGTSLEDIGTYADGEIEEYGRRITVKNTFGSETTTYWRFNMWLEGTCADDQEAARGRSIAQSTVIALL